MITLLGILACAALFALFGALHQRADCGGSCGACGGVCARHAAPPGDDA